MPALPVVTNGFLVTQHYKRNVERADMLNRFCVIALATTPTAIATKLAATFVATLWNLYDNSYTLGQTDVLPLDGSSSTQTFTTASAGAAGGHVDIARTSNGIAMVVAWQTGLKGRSKRGRSFLASPGTDQLVDPSLQALTAAAISSLQTQATAFLTGLNAAPNPSLGLAILSRKLGSAQLVVTARADTVCHSQRRRWEKVARH